MASRDIIVMGASAGGVEALRETMHSIPADFDASVFVVLHLSADAPSVLPNILERAGKLPVIMAEDRQMIRQGTVYVAAPDHHLLLEHGRTRVVRGPKENRHRPAIDTLFRSAAWAYGPRVVGVVLSGYLDDGAAGLWAVKTCGGITVVQDPVDAQVPDMPRNAMMALDVDHALAAERIGPLLVRLSQESLPNGDRHRAPEGMKREIEFAMMEGHMDDMSQLGTLSAFTCPTCRGALWELRDGEMIRYRCFTGHAFSPESLAVETDEAAEDALYSALRALEEKAEFSRRMAQSFSERLPKLEAKHLAEAKELDKKAMIVRELISGENERGAKRTERRRKASPK